MPISRYQRQITLPEVGMEGQEKLHAAHVLIVGTGGLGVPVIQYLAGAGVGRLTLVDGDHIEESNLHRQPLYRMADLGKPKVTVAARAINELNPDIQVATKQTWLHPDNAEQLVEQASLVLDCADNFAVSFTLSDTCRQLGKPLLTASALGLQGYVAGVCGSAPSLRAVFPDLPVTAPTCSAAGILGPVVAMMGTLQAQMALAVLLDLSPSPLGQMIVLDAQRWRTADFRFDHAPEPTTFLPFIAARDIQPNDLVIDLRSEAPMPFHPNALHLPCEDVLHLPIGSEVERVVLACRTGLRAYHSGEALQARWPGKVVLMSVPG